MTKKSSAPKSPTKNPPQKQVLLLSCMDLRLADDTARFMDAYNLQNRYDHLTFAGAAMGALHLGTPIEQPNRSMVTLPWKKVFFHHFQVAIEVLRREIKDVFLVEHFDCGAYKNLHPSVDVRREYERLSRMDMKLLEPIHAEEAAAFADEIKEFCDERQVFHGTVLVAIQTLITAGSNAPSEVKKLFRQEFEPESTCPIEKWKVPAAELLYRKLIETELKVAAWKDIGVRAYVLDLKGNPIDLF